MSTPAGVETIVGKDFEPEGSSVESQSECLPDGEPEATLSAASDYFGLKTPLGEGFGDNSGLSMINFVMLTSIGMFLVGLVNDEVSEIAKRMFDDENDPTTSTPLSELIASRIVVILFPHTHALSKKSYATVAKNAQGRPKLPRQRMSILKRVRSISNFANQLDGDDKHVLVRSIVNVSNFSIVLCYVALLTLDLSPWGLRYVVEIAGKVSIGLRVFAPLSNATSLIAEELGNAAKLSNSLKSGLILIASSVQGLIWILCGLQLLSMVGFDTSKALAGLGIGGIVVGFALQKTLTDIFGTLALLADGNFTTGDFIILSNGERGEVLQIGFRTTRIQSLEDGEILCIPNSKLSSEIVKNQDSMKRRRVKIAIEVEKSTPSLFFAAFLTRSSKLCAVSTMQSLATATLWKSRTQDTRSTLFST